MAPPPATSLWTVFLTFASKQTALWPSIAKVCILTENQHFFPRLTLKFEFYRFNSWIRSNGNAYCLLHDETLSDDSSRVDCLAQNLPARLRYWSSTDLGREVCSYRCHLFFRLLFLLLFIYFLSSKQLQMWLAKDEYEQNNKDHPLGLVCSYPVHSLKQRKFLESSSANAQTAPASSILVRTGPPSTTSYLSEICITGSSLSAIKYTRTTDSAPVVTNGQGSSSNEPTSPNERESGGVRSILNILDSFKIEDMKEAKATSPVTTVNTGSGGNITVVESNVSNPSKEKKLSSGSTGGAAPAAVFNEESIINGMSQGDRLQQIKSMRRLHSRSTTTGALKYLKQLKYEFLTSNCNNI